jgi:hypothetical protein
LETLLAKEEGDQKAMDHGALAHPFTVHRTCDWFRQGLSGRSVGDPHPPLTLHYPSTVDLLAFSIPRINALRGYVIENKSRPIFPS